MWRKSDSVHRIRGWQGLVVVGWAYFSSTLLMPLGIFTYITFLLLHWHQPQHLTAFVPPSHGHVLMLPVVGCHTVLLLHWYKSQHITAFVPPSHDHVSGPLLLDTSSVHRTCWKKGELDPNSLSRGACFRRTAAINSTPLTFENWIRLSLKCICRVSRCGNKHPSSSPRLSRSTAARWDASHMIYTLQMKRQCHPMARMDANVSPGIPSPSSWSLGRLETRRAICASVTWSGLGIRWSMPSMLMSNTSSSRQALSAIRWSGSTSLVYPSTISRYLSFDKWDIPGKMVLMGCRGPPSFRVRRFCK